MRTLCTSPAGAAVTESDDLISLSWSWTDVYEGFPPYAHRITWIKGEVGLYYETRNPDGRWIATPIRHPDYQASNVREAREMATSFITAEET